MKTKYEGVLRKTAVMIANGQTKKADHFLNKLWKRQDEMTDVEIEVMHAQKRATCGRPYEGYTFNERIYRTEGRLLARQEAYYD